MPLGANTWLVNGAPDGAVHPSDRGLAYGDGLFETMAARDGAVPWLGHHLERLADGCRRLAIPLPDPHRLREEIRSQVPATGRAVVKLIVTRGSGARGYAPPGDPNPTRLIGIAPWPEHPASNYTRGIRMRTLKLRLGENAALAGLKHLCRLEQVLARQELQHAPDDEGLMLDGRGFAIGGTSCNVFAVTAGSRVGTPRLDRCGVRGVMRRIVLERCAALGLEASERDMDVAALYAAEELFVTNAVFGIWPVRRLDGQVFEPGRVTRALQDALGYGTDG